MISNARSIKSKMWLEHLSFILLAGYCKQALYLLSVELHVSQFKFFLPKLSIVITVNVIDMVVLYGRYSRSCQLIDENLRSQIVIGVLTILLMSMLRLSIKHCDFP